MSIEITVTLTEAQAHALATPVNSVELERWNTFADDYDAGRAAIRRALREQVPEVPREQATLELGA